MVLAALKSLFGGSRRSNSAKESTFSAPLAPEKTFYAIGDIHGCDTLLTELLRRLESQKEAGSPVIFLGDYVDRGPDSAAVLSRLHKLSREASYPVICLMGNHEKMLLEFIDDPVGEGLRWLRHGGIETLESYGLTGVTVKSDMEELWRSPMRLRRPYQTDFRLGCALFPCTGAAGMSFACMPPWTLPGR